LQTLNSVARIKYKGLIIKRLLKKANLVKAGDAKPTSLKPQGDDGRVASERIITSVSGTPGQGFNFRYMASSSTGIN